MRKLYTTIEIADYYNISPRRVRKLSALRNTGAKVGGQLVFTKHDLVAMKPHKTGYPRGRPRKTE